MPCARYPWISIRQFNADTTARTPLDQVRTTCPRSIARSKVAYTAKWIDTEIHDDTAYAIRSESVVPPRRQTHWYPGINGDIKTKSDR